MMINAFYWFLLATPIMGEFRLQVLHMNDFHSRFEEISDGGGECKLEDKCYGGVARLQTALKTSRQKGVHTLVLNAGDNFQGTPYYSVYKWQIVAAFLDRLNIDAMTIGNHEFDNGIEGLAPFIQNVSTPIVVCNLNLTSEPRLQLDNIRPSIILNFNGTKVGIIGYLTPDTKNLAIIKDDLILDEIPSLISEAKRLKEANVSIIIGLGHSGIIMDKMIAEEVNDIDLIVGAHSHTFLYSGEPPSTDIPLDTYPVVVTQTSGKQVPIVQAYAYSKYLGNISLTFSDRGDLLSFEGNPILLDNSIPQDEEMLAYLETWSKNLLHFKNTVVGKSLVRLDSNCTSRECNLGNLVTDAMIHKSAKRFNINSSAWTDASIAVLQGGGIRATLDYSHVRDNVTVSDLMTAFPFENEVERTEVTGQVLWEMLEWSVAAFNPSGLESAKAFLQVSGLQVIYDITQPSLQRVVKTLVRCNNCTVPRYYPLERSQKYSILTTSFLLFGGDGYSMLRDNHSQRFPLGGTVCDIVTEYITDIHLIYPEVNGRTRFLQDDEYLNNKAEISCLSPLFSAFVFVFFII